MRLFVWDDAGASFELTVCTRAWELLDSIAPYLASAACEAGFDLSVGVDQCQNHKLHTHLLMLSVAFVLG
jgi:hypothetical protein